MKIKKLGFVTFALSCAVNVFSQDIIITKNAEKINAKVEKIGADEIEFRKWDNQTGPLHTIKKAEVSSLIYQNGTVELFGETQPATASLQSPKKTQPFIATGTTIPVKLVSQIESDNENMNPHACVMSTVFDADGKKLIAEGTQVLINVTERRSHGMGSPGWVKIECINTFDVNGNPVFLEGGLYKKGERHLGRALGLGFGLGLTVLCPFGFLFFCLHGDDVVFPVNTVIPNVVVISEQMVPVDKNQSKK